MGSFLVILVLMRIYQLSQTGVLSSANNRTKRKNTKGTEIGDVVIIISRNMY